MSDSAVDGLPVGDLTRRQNVDNITLYCLTGTGASAARSYRESRPDQARAGELGEPDVLLPVGFTTFPEEIWGSSRSWVEQSCPNVTHVNEVDRGGHFAAWEEPQRFAEEVRAAIRSLR
jgi:hypothetical protein